jgi:uncharacterized membrane protein
MFQLPPIPSLNGLHPLIIHFPIALLLVAPLFVLIGAVLTPPRGRSWQAAAFILMLLGTAAVFVAIESGEAAGKLAERSPEINVVLERHSGLAERTSYAFAGLTIAFAAILACGRLLRRDRSRVFATVLPLALLVAYIGAALLLVNTAHNGGLLVHQLGVKAIVAGASVTAETPASGPRDD